MSSDPNSDYPLLRIAYALATSYLDSLAERPVGARATLEELRGRLGRPLTDDGLEPAQVLEELSRDADPGLVASAGPRYYGFVIGGSLPVALATDWLVSAWDQNVALYSQSPAAAVVEDVVAGWVLDLLGLPSKASVTLVTGCQMASFTGLIAARHAVLRRAGWDVEENGLGGAPPVSILVGADAHVTIYKALRMLGFGSRAVTQVPADSQGRMRASDLERILAVLDGPAIVCAQAGNVNSGACDPLADVTRIARERDAWVHVDGAFGLWAAASPRLRHLVAGVAAADSWATDAHKWLNVPYDSGIAIVADGEAQRAALAARASYLMQSGGAERNGIEWAPESSRRARGFVLYSALRALGRRGVAELVERDVRLAQRMASTLLTAPGVRILNDVVLNQVLVSFAPPPGADGDAYTQAVVARIQREGTCWLGSTRWNGREAVRISVSGWATTEADVDRSAAAILQAAAEEAVADETLARR